MNRPQRINARQQTMRWRGTPLPRRLVGIRWVVLLLISTMGATRAHDNDERALEAFKERISDHSGVLASWNRSISYCAWEGVTCSQRHRSRVVALDLNSQGLSGTISPAIGNLTFLQMLNLSFNPLYGEIPPSISSLRRLKYLGLLRSATCSRYVLYSYTTTASLGISHHHSGISPGWPSCPWQLTILRDPSPRVLGTIHISGSFSWP